jgi:hypothetical protein
MPNAELQAWVTLAKDILTGIAALVAAYVGLRGFDAWKRQLTANAERDLARRVLVAVYKVRDAVEGCRVLAWEGDSDIVDVTKKIHDMKFEILDETKAGLDAELLEAKAVWGSEEAYQHFVRQLQNTIHTLKAAYSRYYSPTYISEDIDSMGKRGEAKILFTKTTFRKDEFSTELERTVNEVEDFLRPKLTLKQERSWAWWRRFKK